MKDISIDLQEIDFSQPDGTFTYREQTYHVKQYLEKYFFKKILCQNLDPLYSFIDLYPGEYVCEKGELPNTIAMFTGSIIENIQRCIQYEGVIFCFCFSFGN